MNNILFIIISIIYTVSYANAQTTIYDRDYHRKGSVSKDGIIYNEKQERTGKIQDNKIYDKDGKVRGYIDNNRIYDSNYQYKGKIEKDRVLDKDHRTKYRLEKK